MAFHRARRNRARGEKVTINGKKVWLKSQVEVRFARVLQRLQDGGYISPFEYEPRDFWFEDIKRGIRSYRPDFRVMWLRHVSNCSNAGEYWYETKALGSLRQSDITKYRRLSKRYPDINLILVLDRKPSRGSSKTAIRHRSLVSDAEKYVHHVSYLSDWELGW